MTLLYVYSNNTTEPHATLIYLFDPLCSWCLGFAPELRGLLRSMDSQIRFELICGGMFVECNERRMKTIARHIAHFLPTVAETTGLILDLEFLEKLEQGEVLIDSEPASRAIVVARKLAPTRIPAFSRALQESFYRGQLDLSDPECFRPLLPLFSISPDDFYERFDTEEARQWTHDEFERARPFGLSGFPTLLLKKQDRVRIVCRGYTRLEQLLPQFEHQLQRLY